MPEGIGQIVLYTIEFGFGWYFLMHVVGYIRWRFGKKTYEADHDDLSEGSDD